MAISGCLYDLMFSHSVFILGAIIVFLAICWVRARAVPVRRVACPCACRALRTLYGCALLPKNGVFIWNLWTLMCVSFLGKKKCFDPFGQKSQNTCLPIFYKKAKAKTLLSFVPFKNAQYHHFWELASKQHTLFHHRNNKNQRKVWAIEMLPWALPSFKNDTKIFQVLLSVIELYQVCQVYLYHFFFTKFHQAQKVKMSNLQVSGATTKIYQVSKTKSYQVQNFCDALPKFEKQQPNSIKFWVLPSFTEFYPVFTAEKFYQVLSSFQQVLLSF